MALEPALNIYRTAWKHTYVFPNFQWLYHSAKKMMEKEDLAK
jgi:hypothetical protein